MIEHQIFYTSASQIYNMVICLRDGAADLLATQTMDGEGQDDCMITATKLQTYNGILEVIEAKEKATSGN
jgi:hypothetical protein